MIHYLRLIRQRLLSENKFSKYLLYAIGEITLVVIGILIALQINNWNDNRKQQIQEQKLLVSLKSDFLESKNRLQQTMYMQKNVIRKSSELIKMYEGKIPRASNDSIKNFIVYGAQSWYRAEFLTGAYDAYISTGNAELLCNNQLRKMLAEYFSIVKLGFEDQDNSMNLLNNMQNISAPVSAHLELTKARKRIGLDTLRSPKENMAIDFIFKQDAYFGYLMNRVAVEHLRYTIQEEVLNKISQIVVILNEEIEL
ncbi:hypothetical protein ADIWIN_0940 [Winogradskyella psychrotolerans RS-3]|uniref:Uncharacterized protein n=1 Tax=Winogradskyella psychrotolerans RS-3 TaxID=641526 RepID=S7VUK7_9FLAO|nr:DUF6090 family protein [Winogradskyella psychrotolerans]EPR73980.1 hypothetical protein ADIWIN_0940 [Winogradskyella psychrotolerans RS-3]